MIFGITLGSSRLWLFISVLFIVGIMNAVNCDGLDGLASAWCDWCRIFLYVCHHAPHGGLPLHATTASLTVVLSSEYAGFLWFNSPVLSHLMGGEPWASFGRRGIVTGKIDPSLLGRQRVIVSALPSADGRLHAPPPTSSSSVRRMSRGKSPFIMTVHISMTASRCRALPPRLVAIWMWTAIVSPLP